MMTEISYSGYRFPPEIIQQAIWLYVRFTLSFHDVEDLLAERGIVVSFFHAIALNYLHYVCQGLVTSSVRLPLRDFSRNHG